MGRGEDGRAILLTGMMGAGKSRIGARLAERLGFAFLDTDREIERRAGSPVREIFERHGETRFRALERDVLAELPSSRTVVALGGGSVASSENRALLRDKGLLVWLWASPECLARRLERSASRRPLLAGLNGVEERAERLRELLVERRPAYESAELQVDTDGMTLAEATDAVLAAVREEGAA